MKTELAREGQRSVLTSAPRLDLQGMRAVAVLMVFANHLFDWPPGGFVGVDVFFVLSGFFITGLLVRERTTTGTVSFRNFYIRRIKRILPSALLVLAATVIGSYILFPAVRARDTLLDALYAALFVSNFRFEAVGADYFQQDQPPSPLQHYWSLSIEEQFYFVWPALLVALFLITRRFMHAGRPWVRQWSLFAAMAAVVAASFAWATHLSRSDPNVAYFSTFTRVWELGIGALLAIAAPWCARIPAVVRPALAYLGLAGVVSSLFVVDPGVQFPAPWAALPVVSTAVVVASFQGAEVRGMIPLTNPVARYLGDTSYTLYLWHWPVIILLFSIMPKGLLFDGIAIALALALTAVTYHFYENPIRKSDWLTEESSSRMKPSAWAVVGGLTAASLVLTIAYIGYSEKISSAQELTAARNGTAPEFAPLSPKPDPCFGAPAMVNPGCALWTPSAPLMPGIDRFAKDNKGRQSGCFSEAGEALKSCTYGYTGDDAVEIAVVGDSHAAAILPALWPVLTQNRWHLTTYVGAGCRFGFPRDPRCQEDKIAEALRNTPYDLIFTTNRNIQGRTPEGYIQAWSPLAEAGRRIAVLKDNPVDSEESIACLTRMKLGDDAFGDCGTPRSDAIPPSDAMVAAAQVVPGTQVIDLTKFYCTADRCPSVIGNVIVYQDAENAHLTSTFARTLAPALEDGLRRALA